MPSQHPLAQVGRVAPRQSTMYTGTGPRHRRLPKAHAGDSTISVRWIVTLAQQPVIGNFHAGRSLITDLQPAALDELGAEQPIKDLPSSDGKLPTGARDLHAVRGRVRGG